MSNCECGAKDCVYCSPPTIDEFRKKNWGKLPCCVRCGDPVILADTEEWKHPLCADCFDHEDQMEPVYCATQRAWQMKGSEENVRRESE